MLEFASTFAAQSAAPTVFVKVKMRPTMGMKLNNNAATPKLHDSSQPMRLGTCTRGNLRGVLWPVSLDETLALCVVPALELEVPRVPARPSPVPIDEQECRRAEGRNRIQRQREEVPDDPVARERLQRAQEHAALVRGGELGLAVLDELALAVLEERRVEDVLERGLEEERLREEGEQEDGLGAKEEEREHGPEGACDEGKHCRLGNVGEECEHEEEHG